MVHRTTASHKASTRAISLPSESNDLFERQPAKVGGFLLRARSAVPVGRPSIEGWTTALGFAVAANDASPFWIGDLVAYADSRKEWKDKLDQAIAMTGLALQTLHNLGYISRKIEEPERRLAQSVAHADAVAPLARQEQTKWLSKSRTEGWSVRELRTEIRASSRRKVIEGQAVLEGMFRVIYSDPPWAYNDRGDIRVGKSSAYKRAEAHYPTMTIEELCKLPVEAHALKDSILFLWVTAPMLLQNPGPREVLEAWGFTYKENFVWDKVLGNFGHYNHVQHEHLIVATRGSCLPDQPTPQPKSIIVERRSDVHSAKPESVRKMIERHWTVGPYLELFGRERHENWTVFGNDARLWSQDAEQSA